MPFLIYSVLRLALILVLGVILYAFGLRDLLLPVVAIVLALMVSYLLLAKQREAAAVYLASRKTNREVTGERFSRAVEDDATLEDSAVDSVVDRARPGPAKSVPEAKAAPDAEPEPGAAPRR